MAVVDNTKLTAVNRMLSSIGTAPVTTLGVRRSAILAEAVLDETNQSVQGDYAWDFNTDYNVKITPVANQIPVPTDALRIVPRDPSWCLVHRGGFMFDQKKNSNNEFNGDVYFDITRLLDVTELPDPARNYIIARAARVYQSRHLSSSTMARELALYEQKAWDSLVSHESAGGRKANALNNTISGAGRTVYGRGNALRTR